MHVEGDFAAAAGGEAQREEARGEHAPLDAEDTDHEVQRHRLINQTSNAVGKIYLSLQILTEKP